LHFTPFRNDTKREERPKRLRRNAERRKNRRGLLRLTDQGKLPEALEIYQHSLITAKALAEQDKSNSRWQWDLSLCYQNLGDVLVARGELPDALKAYQQSLQIRQTLVERDRTNSGWQRDLLVFFFLQKTPAMIVLLLEGQWHPSQ
jgi:tetratricopeptide (TPR) repeat protein